MGEGRKLPHATLSKALGLLRMQQAHIFSQWLSFWERKGSLRRVYNRICGGSVPRYRANGTGFLRK